MKQHKLRKSKRPVGLGRSNLLGRLLLPENGFFVFLTAIAIVYCAVPLSVALVMPGLASFILLAALSAMSILAMWVGNRVTLLDRCFLSKTKRLRISKNALISSIWLLFTLFMIITFATAPTVPLFSALAGADASEVSQQRGDFLKAREGLEAALIYISTFVTTFVPYTIIILYEQHSKFRHLSVIIFVLYAISFMAKSIFLYVGLPILVFLAIKRRFSTKVFLYLAACSLLLLIGLTYLSFRGGTATESGAGFFTAQYIPSSPLSYFVWRSVSVPIFTAADTLLVHKEQFGGDMLMGATSSFIAGLVGMEKINLERFVFEYQFGSWNTIANSNAVFITDAFVNFGWIGVIFLSVIVGQIFRWFRLSKDVAFRAQWINFAFLLFSASFIGTLLSNWWAVMLAYALFIKINYTHINFKQNASNR